MRAPPKGLKAEHEGRRVLVRIASEDRENRISPDMMTWLTDLLQDPPESARVLTLSAEGPVYCLGPTPAGVVGQSVRDLGRSIASFNRAMIESELITIAEVNGIAAGFGVGLACLPDITIGGDNASFVLPEVLHDLTPALVLSWLQDLVGPKTSRFLAVTGLPLDVGRAHQLGLVDLVVSSDNLESETDRLVAHVMTLAPATVHEIKTFARDRRGLSREDAEVLAIARMSAWNERREV